MQPEFFSIYTLAEVKFLSNIFRFMEDTNVYIKVPQNYMKLAKTGDQDNLPF